MKYIVVTNNKQEFIQVAEYYNWQHYQKHQIDAWRETYAILLEDNNPTGWSGINYLTHTKAYEVYKRISFAEWQTLVGIKTKEIKMKYVVEVNNASEKASVEAFIGYTFGDTAFRAYPWGISSRKEHSRIGFYQENQHTYGPIISYRTWALMFDIKPLKANKTLELTSDYSAEVNYNTKIVQVGCQSIPFSKVEELAKLIKE